MGGVDTTATKRRYSRLSQSLSLGAVPASNHIHLPTRSAAARRPSSKLMNSNIDDLPDGLLVEILSRLPCKKFVFQCKCVSKRWCTLMSNPYFIGCFLRLRSHDHIISTLINRTGEEFLSRMSLSSKPLMPLFERLVSFYDLKEEPLVVATYNDLVLCCASKLYQRDYYICNPHTIQWVALPPPPQVYDSTCVGFICDLPYYSYEKDDDDRNGHIIQVNAEYRCKVVRIPYCHQKFAYDSFKFKVEIFSFETGEWRESIVSSPQGFRMDLIDSHISFVCNGMLYWSSYVNRNFVIGLDPFRINSNNSASTTTSSSCSTNGDEIIDHYECHFIQVAERIARFSARQCLGVSRGRLLMCDYGSHPYNYSLSVWELKEEEEDEIDGAGKLCFKHKRVYWLDRNMYMEELELDEDDEGEDIDNLLACDPNDEDIIYLMINREIIMYNVTTRERSKIGAAESVDDPNLFQLNVLPWPTPVPRLPQRANHSGVN